MQDGSCGFAQVHDERRNRRFRTSIVAACDHWDGVARTGIWAALAGILLLVLTSGCGGSKKAAAPAERHLVYVKGDGISTPHVWIAKPDGSGAHVLTTGSLGILSPDGRTVAVARRKKGIFLVPTSGGAGHRLTSRNLQPQAWSPDGKTLVALAATDRAVYQIVSLDRDSGEQHVLARGSLYGFDFSPDGDQIVYSRAPEATYEGICGDQFDLYVAKLDGSSAKRITHDGLSAFPVWGRNAIAFSRFPADSGASTQACSAPGVWMVQPDGSDDHAVIARAPDSITLAGYYGFQPLDWLDDEHVLVGLRTDSGTEGAIVDTKTKHLRRLGDYADVASHDGRYSVGSGGTAYLIMSVLRLSDGHRVLLRKNACCPSWNR
jgi:dipeptidyl aminopeptidase/acylaminoacyl peptidase